MSIGSEEELRGMKAAGAIVARVLAAMKQHVRAGVTTRQLDEIGARVIRESGAVSAPRMVYHFPVVQSRNTPWRPTAPFYSLLLPAMGFAFVTLGAKKDRLGGAHQLAVLLQ